MLTRALFEDGYVYVHDKCALWSCSVSKRKREKPEQKIHESERYIGLDVCVATRSAQTLNFFCFLFV